MAAVLAGGPGSVLSHRSAAGLWGLIHPINRLDVTRNSSSAHRREPPVGWSNVIQSNLIFHRTGHLPPGDITLLDRIPVTSVLRTLLDLAGVFSRSRLGSVASEAERLGILSLDELASIVERGRGWKGIGVLRELAEEWSPEQTATRSELESEFLDLCARSAIPVPRVNSTVEGFEVDCSWPRSKLLVELDGFAYHSGRGAFERDRQRDAALQLSGHRVLRLTHRMVIDQPDETIRQLRGLLASSDDASPVSEDR